MKSAVKLLNETGSYEAVIYLTEEKVKRREVAWRVEHAVVVAMEAVYRFDQMKSEKAEVRRPLRKLTLSVPQRSDLDRRRGRRGARARHRARHGPRARSRQPAGQRLHADVPRRARAGAGARSFPTLKVTVLERKEIEELGMGSFLSVTNGSDEPPRFIVFEYHGSARKKQQAAGAGRQGHHVRHRRHLAQARRPTWTR